MGGRAKLDYRNGDFLGNMLPAGGKAPAKSMHIKKKDIVSRCPFGTADDALDQHIANLGRKQPDLRFDREEGVGNYTSDAAMEAMRWGRTLASKNRRHGKELRAPFRTMDPGGHYGPAETPRGSLPYDGDSLRESYVMTKDIYRENKVLAAARRDPITHQLHDAAGNVIDSMPYEAAATVPNLPSSEEVAQADIERARRWRMAYRDMQENGPSWMSEEARYAADGNNTPFPVGS